MIKEELKKEAKEYVSKYEGWGWRPHEGSPVFEAMYSSYIDSAEPREKRIADLEAQIEKMKCCGNCSHFKLDNRGLYPIYACELTYPNRCKNHDKWEIKENE